MESALPAAGFLYWVGAGTVAYLTLRLAYSLFTSLQVWGLSHEPGVGPGLGEWAGESDPAPPAPSLRQLPRSCGGPRGLRPCLVHADKFRAQPLAFPSSPLLLSETPAFLVSAWPLSHRRRA